MAVLKSQLQDFVLAADHALARRIVPPRTEVLSLLGNLVNDARSIGCNGLAEAAMHQAQALRRQYGFDSLARACEELKAAMSAELTANGWDAHARGCGTLVVYLHPGHLYVAASACNIVTVVGSCVAVVLFERETGIGGMNHFMLAVAPNGERSLKYGAIAMPALLDAVVGAGAKQARLRAAIFGGGSVIAGRLGGALQGPGADNAAYAAAFLDGSRVAVERREVGGAFGRRVEFSVGDGAIDVQTI